MADPISRRQVEAADWPGMMSSIGSQTKTPAAGAIQINLQSNVAGEIHVRPGIREVVFESED